MRACGCDDAKVIDKLHPLNEKSQSAGHDDRLIAEIANLQHGVIARRQLLGAGLNRGAIEWRLRHGRLHAVFRGVYAVGHTALSREAVWMAAVLAGGDGAVLSHLSAAELVRVTRTWTAIPHIIVPRPMRARSGLVAHYSRNIHPDEVFLHRGIPVTTVPRLLVDLADTMRMQELVRVIKEAAYLERFDIDLVERSMQRNLTRRGHGTLVTALHQYLHGSSGLRSNLEAKFLKLVDEAGIEPPSLNTSHNFHGVVMEIDILWQAQRLVVEVDESGHLRPMTTREDDLRDALLRANGYRIIRITEGMMTRRRAAVINRLRAALGAPVAAPAFAG